MDAMKRSDCILLGSVAGTVRSCSRVGMYIGKKTPQGSDSTLSIQGDPRVVRCNRWRALMRKEIVSLQIGWAVISLPEGLHLSHCESLEYYRMRSERNGKKQEFIGTLCFSSYGPLYSYLPGFFRPGFRRMSFYSSMVCHFMERIGGHPLL